jgi:hypothetical protein
MTVKAASRWGADDAGKLHWQVQVCALPLRCSINHSDMLALQQSVVNWHAWAVGGVC